MLDQFYDEDRRDRVQKKIELLQNRLNPSTLELEILTPQFMAHHTPYPSFNDWLTAFGIFTKDDWEGLTSQELETLVRTTTRFPGWEAMLTAAYNQWLQDAAADKLHQLLHQTDPDTD